MDRQKLIEDTIKVNVINDGGQVFDRGKSLTIQIQSLTKMNTVSRIGASSQVNRLEIEMDVNTDIYEMHTGEFYKLVLATSVNADGSDNFDVIQYENAGSQGGMGALIDQYDYVMHGKIFKYQLSDDQKNM